MTVKEFYEWCVEHGVENYKLDCYGITFNGTALYRTDVKEKDIQIDYKFENTIILFEQADR